jgi:hypothetical protein
MQCGHYTVEAGGTYIYQNYLKGQRHWIKRATKDMGIALQVKRNALEYRDLDL